MKKRKDYCGNDMLPQKFNKFLSYFHNPSCRLHDKRYDNQIGKLKADFLFLSDMIFVSIKRISKGAVGLALCPFMFLGVLLLGRSSYNRIRKD